jgi:DNA-binding phage protein
MIAVDKLRAIAKPRSKEALDEESFRKENLEWLRMSQEIALGLHYYLRSQKMTQKALAEKLGMSAVYVNRLLKGGENLTLETICKIQSAIGHPLISVCHPYTDFESSEVEGTATPMRATCVYEEEVKYDRP